MSERAATYRAGYFLVALCIFTGVGAASSPARADAKLDPLFSSGAVLQQGRPISIFGRASEGDVVTISIQDFTVRTVAAGDRWSVEVGPLRPGGPYSLTLTGTRSYQTNGVYVGEVWVCAGHSNMQWPLINAVNSAAVTSSPVSRQLRFFNVPREGSREPKATADSLWMSPGSASLGNFSAIGCFFAAELQPKYNVPFGLIGCNHYASTAEAWTSAESITANLALKHLIDDTSRSAPDAQIPGRLFNGMLCPISQFAFRGVLWYQGESNVERAEEYRRLFPLLISDWRKQTGRPDLPFLFVQLAPYKPAVAKPGDSRWAELRESQLLTWKKTPHTAMVVITDHGDQYDLHPRDKQPVAHRLALAARALAYGEQLEYSGPRFVKYTIVNDKVVCEFDHVGGGLEFKGEKPLGFAIAGRDRRFIETSAEIDGNKVILRHDTIPAPEAVRYGWADFPVGNLYNVDGLPASPFRTDTYPLTTLRTPKAAE